MMIAEKGSDLIKDTYLNKQNEPEPEVETDDQSVQSQMIHEDL